MGERCERGSERTSEWPSTLRADFIVILPIVQCLNWSVGSSVRPFHEARFQILIHGEVNVEKRLLKNKCTLPDVRSSTEDDEMR